MSDICIELLLLICFWGAVNICGCKEKPEPARSRSISLQLNNFGKDPSCLHSSTFGVSLTLVISGLGRYLPCLVGNRASNGHMHDHLYYSLMSDQGPDFVRCSVVRFLLAKHWAQKIY